MSSIDEGMKGDKEMQKKIGWLSLSGLIVGPILGSGIILLPTTVLGVAGDWALPAWVLMVGVSFFFAYIFSWLTILVPGAAGVTGAIERAFGQRAKRLAAFYLIGAGLFGPVAVLMILGEYFAPVINQPVIPVVYVSLFICLILMLRRITSIGKVAFALSTVCAMTLFGGGSLTLLTNTRPFAPFTPFALEPFGYALLLLFWIIVGWEVIGNYSDEVKDPRKTFPKAVIFSALVIAAVDLVVAAAMQFVQVPVGEQVSLAHILWPLFGCYAVPFIGVLTLLLCMNTYLVFIGSISRLACSMAEEGNLPAVFGRRNGNGAPSAAILAFVVWHSLVLFVYARDLIGVEVMVAVVDGFFIANATVGILAGMKLFKRKALKAGAAALALLFVGILLFSHPVVTVVIGVMAVGMMIQPGEQMGRETIEEC